MVDIVILLFFVSEALIFGLIGYVFVKQRKIEINNAKHHKYLEAIDESIRLKINTLVTEVKAFSQLSGNISGREKQINEDRIAAIDDVGLPP